MLISTLTLTASTLLQAPATAAAAPPIMPAPQWLRQSSYGMRYTSGKTDEAEWVQPQPNALSVPFYQVRGGDTVASFARVVRFVREHRARPLAYVCFMDTVLEPEKTGVPTGRPAFSRQMANALLVDENLRFVNTRMDGSWRLHRYLMCYNNELFVENALEHVRALLQLGIQGFFVDNAGSQHECFGHGRRYGWSDRYGTIASRYVEPKPTDAQDPSLQQLPVHTHIDPNINQTEAFHRFLRRMYDLVKAEDPNHIVILNNNTSMPDACDGAMWESFICSWAWEGRRLSWSEVKARSGAYTRLIEMGKVVIPLTYLGRTKATVVEDAYFCYAAARLLGFAWCDAGTGGRDPKVMALRAADLGAPLDPLQTVEENVEYRLFPRGVVVINDTDAEKVPSIRLNEALSQATFTDLFDNRTVRPEGGMLKVSVPAHSGRVYAVAAPTVTPR